MRISIIGLVFLALGGCISVNPGLGSGPACEMTASGDLLLRGYTTQPMLDCVQKQDLAPVKRVILDSSGGPLPVALEIGEKLAGLHVEMVVRGQCNSACANYFLPVASRITVEPGSSVLLHGSADEGALSHAKPEAVASLRKQFDAQTEYAARHGIPSGWLLMRTAEDVAAKKAGTNIVGKIAQPFTEGQVNVKAMRVEESFMRSCLKVEITPFQETIAQRVYIEERLAHSLAGQGIFPSGTMACVLDETPEQGPAH